MSHCRAASEGILPGRLRTGGPRGLVHARNRCNPFIPRTFRKRSLTPGRPPPSAGRLLREELAHLVHPGLRAGVVAIAVLLADRVELAEQLLLSLGQANRRLDDDVAVQVTVGLTANPLD